MHERTAGRYERRVSFSERTYLASDPRGAYNCAQIVVQGDGAVSEGALRAAVERAAEVNPGCRLVLRGALGFMRWVPLGPVPTTRVVEGWEEDGPPPRGVSRALAPERGPTCEVVLAPSSRPRIVFRCYHGVMDARGLLLFAEDVCRALRGEPPLGHPSTITEGDLIRSLVGERTRPSVLKSDALPVTGAGSTRGWGDVVSRRISVNGPVPALIAKVAAALARHAGRYHTERVRIAVPIDMRNYKKELRNTGNLVHPLFIDVGRDESWQQIHKSILKRLAAREVLQLFPGDSIVPWFPIWLLRASSSLMIAGSRRGGRFPLSAFVSNIVLQGTSMYSGGGFECRSVYPLPMSNELVPLFVTAISLPEQAEVIVSAPRDLVGGGRFDELCDVVKSSLATDAAG